MSSSGTLSIRNTFFSSVSVKVKSGLKSEESVDNGREYLKRSRLVVVLVLVGRRLCGGDSVMRLVGRVGDFRNFSQTFTENDVVSIGENRIETTSRMPKKCATSN